MNQETLLLRIRQYLAIMSKEVYIANSNNEFGINIHIENVIIPILNVLFNCELKNANYKKSKNYVSIDLFDSMNRIAFQITSTTTNNKIINTLIKFKQNNIYKNFETLNILIIRDNKPKYKKVTVEQINHVKENRFNFDISKNVFDFSDLYRLINEVEDIKTIARIANILQDQYTDITNLISFENKYESTIKQYKNFVLSTTFKRINFFGLSISKKPREIDLYSLFVNPLFRRFLRYGFKNYEYTKSMFPIDEIISSESDKLHFDAVKSTSDISYNVSDIEHKESIHEYRFRNKLNNFNAYSLDSSILTLEEVIGEVHRAVILGKPGAGKSSFIKYIMCKIMESYSLDDAINYSYNLFPIRVELADYYKNKQNCGDDFVKYIVKSLYKKYNVDGVTENILKYILMNRRALVFFDGLDEIFELVERAEIRDEIEMFCERYNKSKVIVTSRYESNEEISFSMNFDYFEVLGFDKTQRNKYIEKWYSIEEPDDATREAEINSCKGELEKISDELKTNPLLLSLIVIIYRNDLSLPTSKLEIYESCTNTIIETRDKKEKRLEFDHKVRNVSATFSDLAFWQFNGIAKKQLNSLTYDDVLRHVKQYLLSKGECDDEIQAMNIARKFLDFAKIRSIYFENNFTHKTFLEYFTSNYIYSTYYIKALNRNLFYDIINNNIGNASWAIVLELLLSKVDREQLDFEEMDEIVSLILKKDIKSAIFLFQILKYLNNISPRVLRKLFVYIIEFCVKGFNNTSEKEERNLCIISLIDLLSSTRFDEYFQDSFDMYSGKILEENFKYIAKVFYLEIMLVSNYRNYYLIDTIRSSQSVSTHEYVLLYMLDKKAYNVSNNEISIFLDKYNVQDFIRDYNMYFASSINGGRPVFNWLIYFLFPYENLNNFDEKIAFLVELGIDEEKIALCIEGSALIIKYTTLQRDKLGKIRIGLKHKNLFDQYYRRTRGMFGYVARSHFI